MKYAYIVILSILVMIVSACQTGQGWAPRSQITERVTCKFIDINQQSVTSPERCYSDLGDECQGVGLCSETVQGKRQSNLYWESTCQPIDANGNKVDSLTTTMDGKAETLTFLCEEKAEEPVFESAARQPSGDAPDGGTTGTNFDCSSVKYSMDYCLQWHEQGLLTDSAEIKQCKEMYQFIINNCPCLVAEYLGCCDDEPLPIPSFTLFEEVEEEVIIE